MIDIKKKISNLMINLKYSQEFAIAANKTNEIAFSSYRGRHRGESIVICGAGPSLSKYVPIKDAIHIATNRALLYDKVHFDYFFADDWRGISFMQNEIKSYECVKFMGYHNGEKAAIIPEDFIYESGAIKYYTDWFVADGYNGLFITDVDKMAISNAVSIVMQAMQVALFMLPAKIYIVGCDSNMGHFAGKKNDSVEDELQKQYNYSKRTVDRWKEMKAFAEIRYPSIELYSINPVRLKGIFKDVYT